MTDMYIMCELYDISKEISFLKLPMDSGIEPSRLFQDRSKNRSSAKTPMVDGIGPQRALYLRSR
jgi:hypothetical protein